MRIEAPWENKIIVELTNDDMADLDITYEEMDYSNAETKRAIWTILERVRRVIGRDIDPSGKMLIEALPCHSGGCLLSFTTLPSLTKTEKTVIKKNSRHMVFEFDGVDSFLDCRKRIAGVIDEVISCETFELNGNYRVILCAGIYAENLKHILSEYADFCGEGKLNAATTREYWHRIDNGRSDSVQHETDA